MDARNCVNTQALGWALVKLPVGGEAHPVRLSEATSRFMNGASVCVYSRGRGVIGDFQVNQAGYDADFPADGVPGAGGGRQRQLKVRGRRKAPGRTQSIQDALEPVVVYEGRYGDCCGQPVGNRPVGWVGAALIVGGGQRAAYLPLAAAVIRWVGGIVFVAGRGGSLPRAAWVVSQTVAGRMPACGRRLPAGS